MYGRKKKVKPVKQMKEQTCSTCGDTQHKVPQAVKENKNVKPTEVFGSAYTKPKSSSSKVKKGSHRMPDGSIMKDSDMKKSKKSKSK